ncbi:MAG: tyrosine--tRNA ligase [Aeriscardovia sp.]|nr:tyrosine--tRNA ligase [Aeriscardovia sp.]
MDILEDLQWRGLINQETDHEGLKEALERGKLTLYCGTDPTGPSLHIGHLIPFIALKRFQLQGYHPIILIGGATGAIGDPSGRKAERTLQTMEQVEANKKSLKEQMSKIFGPEFKIVDNYSWLSKISLLDMLRDFGKNFSVNAMLSKESVASRIEGGISFTEFSYQILQAIDFLHLFEEEDVTLQIGGADQWGNLTDGIDLIRHKHSKAEVFGFTIPLLLKADGTKFGKSSGGAVWLDPKMTSPYDFYQFWINTDDRDTDKYLKYFTFLSKERIEELDRDTRERPNLRLAQKALAYEVTSFVHGKAEADRAEKISSLLFKGDISLLSADEIEEAFGSAPSVAIGREPVNLVDLLVETGVEKSRRQAREDISSRAVSVNGKVLDSPDAAVDPTSDFDGRFVVIRKGKKNYTLARVSQ